MVSGSLNPLNSPVIATRVVTQARPITPMAGIGAFALTNSVPIGLSSSKLTSVHFTWNNDPMNHRGCEMKSHSHPAR